MNNPTVFQVVKQAMIEMGLSPPTEVVTNLDTTVVQMVGLLGSAGNDLVLGFPWEQLTKEWVLTLAPSQSCSPLPSDWGYFLDQTQWDRTNHWPLMGPKSAQEWQWLKSGSIATGPRVRYRVVGNKVEFFPPDHTGITCVMEYVSENWLADSRTANTFYDIPHSDTDVLLLDFWLTVKYLKLKFWEAKGLDTTAYSADFLGRWYMVVGKNKGAPKLSLAARPQMSLIGPNSIPDGSWLVTP